MGTRTILCIDTQRDTIEALQRTGATVRSVEMGYQTGRRYIGVAPHESDMMVCDLLSPACFDGSKWGPGLNDNHQCTIVPPEAVTYERRYIQRQGSMKVETEPKYRLIQEWQIQSRSVGSPFQPADVFKAISDGGIPFLLFVNHEWAAHLGDFPNFVNLVWRLGATQAEAVTLKPPLKELIPELDNGVAIRRPLVYVIKDGPLSPTDLRPFTDATIAKTAVNLVGDAFGQTVFLGKGSIWLVPQTADNPKTAVLFSTRLDQVRDLQQQWTRAVSEPRPDRVLAQNIKPEPEGAMTISKFRVFVVHGHDEAMKHSVARVLEQIGFEAVILHEQPGQGRTIIEKFEAYSDVGFAIVLLSPDDEGRLRTEGDPKLALQPRARQNVILELGFFLGKLGRQNVVALYDERANIEFPVDYEGVGYIPYDVAGAWKNRICQELRAAGYEADANLVK